MELLFYHTHTEESNRTVGEYMGSEKATENHYADYATLVNELSDDIDPVIVRTEHIEKKASEDTESFHQWFEDDIEELGGQLEHHDTHITGVLGENRFAVIDGVEGTFKEPDSHILLCGVPREEEVNAWNLSNEELYSMSEELAWTGLPHWNIMSPSLEEKESILQESERNSDLDIAISHTTGYGSPMNELVNGAFPSQTGVDEYAEEYGASLIPELDWHTTLPYKLDGVGVIEDGSIDELSEGEIPVDSILDCDIVEYGHLQEQTCGAVHDSWRFGTTLAAPSLRIEDYFKGASRELYRKFAPVEDEDYRSLAESSVKHATDVSIDDLQENTAPL